MYLQANLKFLIMAIVAAGLAPAQAAFAAVMTYDNRPDFEAAIAGLVVTEDSFDTPIAAGDIIVLDSGIISENSEPSLQATDNSVVAGRYANTVALGGIAPDEITWTFPAPVMAIGFDVFGIVSNGLQISFDNGTGLQDYVLADILGGSGEGFVGILSDAPFSQVVFSTALVPTDGFALDNLVFASAPSEVPLPAAFPFMIAGLAWLRCAVKKRRRHISR